MTGPSLPKQLCPRCGAAMPVQHRGRGAASTVKCAECGLGGTTGVVTFTEPAGPVQRWRARRKYRRFLREHQEHAASVVRSARFPLYGLDGSWQGRRWLAGWSTQPDAPERITLGHGDPAHNTGPVLRVSTRASSELPHARVVQEEARTLAMALWNEGAAHTEAIRAPFNATDPTAGWDTTLISVEGHGSLGFKSLPAGPHWMAIGPIGDVVVGLEAHNIEPAELHLVAVSELEPYLDDLGLPRI